MLKAALTHVQFETIHPFLDGNSRLGRLLITLILCEEKILQEPMIYPSLYFLTLRQYYYELLKKVRITGDWESWLEFFAEAVTFISNQAVDTVRQLSDLNKKDIEKIKTLGRATASSLNIHRAILERSIATSNRLSKETGISPATVNNCLDFLELVKNFSFMDWKLLVPLK